MWRRDVSPSDIIYTKRKLFSNLHACFLPTKKKNSTTASAISPKTKLWGSRQPAPEHHSSLQYTIWSISSDLPSIWFKRDRKLQFKMMIWLMKIHPKQQKPKKKPILEHSLHLPGSSWSCLASAWSRPSSHQSC